MANSISDILKAVEGVPKPSGDALSEAMAAYERAFGYLPLGDGMPILTADVLHNAIASGKPIIENIPAGAES